MTALRKLLLSIVEVRPEERRTAALMFAYSFLAMTAYNIVHPVTRSAVISELGADNIPYVLLVSGFLIGILMQGYGWITARLPARWALPALQLGLTALLLCFWVLFRTQVVGVSAALYLFGLILGTLLLSQFWTLANEIYDPRQARRLFGFIGGGASLGGMAGSGLAALVAERTGTDALLLLSAGSLAATAVPVTIVLRREKPERDEAGADRAPSVGLTESWRVLRESPNLTQIAVLIGFSSLGSIVIDQQLNMAAEQFLGADEDAMTRFLASVRFWVSTSAFIAQLLLVKQIYRLLGVGVALLTLPLSLGATAVLILGTGALLAAAAASVVGRAIRYTVDRTTREIFYLPLPASVKRRAKSFVDVTVERLVRGGGAVLMLFLIKPWGLELAWPQLSIVMLALVGVWLTVALRARDRYIEAIRTGLEAQEVEPEEVRVDVADLTTVEALLEELAHPDERRVLYAIDVLESLDKRNLITPLLLHHESPAVRARALSALAGSHPDIAQRWQSTVQRLVDDPDPEVRAKAIITLASVRQEDAATLARGLLEQGSPRMAASAAVVLAASSRPADAALAEATLSRLATGTHASADVRRDVARALRQIQNPISRTLLIPLLQDRDPSVSEAAMQSVRALRPLDPLLVPTLISLLGDRRLKSGARDVLVQYGEPVLDLLGHVLADPDEDVWVRRHVPATLARIPCQRAMDLLVDSLTDRDGFLRYKVVAALETLRRDHPALSFPRDPIDALLVAEARRYFQDVVLRDDVFTRPSISRDALLAQTLREKEARSVDRAYRLLTLLYPWKDISAARWAIDNGDASARARAFEYLDNILPARLRQTVLPMLEDLPDAEKVRRGHAVLRTHPKSLEDGLLALINDDDEIIAAAAIDLIRDQRRWELADDVEHVLAHRPAEDWVVFEAASWTLASRRLSTEQRRTRWLERLPAIVLADRLRRLAMFRSVGIDELCRIAASGQQTRHADGHTLMHEGDVPDALHVVLDGAARVSRRTSEAREIRPPALIGFEPTIEGRPAPETVRAAGPVVTLAIPRDDLLVLLADNTDLVHGLVRTLAESTSADRTPPVLAGRAPDQIARLGTDQPTPIQKALALEQVPVFTNLASEELFHLGTIARAVSFDAGDVLSSETDPPVLCLVLRGTLSLRDGRTDAELRSVRPGDAVGVFETLAGTRRGAVGRAPLRLVVDESGTALRIDRDELFDLIGQRPALLQHMFRALFGARDPAPD